MLIELQKLTGEVEQRVTAMLTSTVEVLLDEAESINKELQKWIGSTKEITEARMKEAYEMALKCQAYLVELQGYATEKLIEQSEAVKEYLGDLQDQVHAELVRQNEILKEKLVELQAKTEQMEKCVATMLEKQMDAFKAKSAEVMRCTMAIAKVANYRIARNVSEVMEKMAELQEMATTLLAEYQVVFAQMSKAVQEQMKEDLTKAMNAFAQATEEFQKVAEKIKQAVKAAQAGNAQKMAELFDMIKNFDYKGAIEQYIKDMMNSDEVQKVLANVTDLVNRIEATAEDIIGYGNAVIDGGVGSTPYGDGVVAQTDVKALESMNSQLKNRINTLNKDVETLNQDVAELAKTNEDLQKIVQKGDSEYKELLANVKNSNKVTKKKVALKKKATKSTKAKQITVNWKKWNAKNGVITKYQVYCKADGTKATKKYVGKNKTKFVVKKLESGKTYKVKVRAIYKLPYKNEAGQTKYLTYYSKWSKAKKVKVK
jgi:hypothetical protein